MSTKVAAEVAEPAPASAAATRWLPTEASPGGCATGECLPEIPEATDAPSPPPHTAPVVTSARALRDPWRAAVDAVRLASTRHGASLAFGRLLALESGVVRIAFGPQAQFHRAAVTGASGRQTVEQALSQQLGRPTRLIVEEGPHPEGLCLAEEDAEARTARVQHTEQQVREHPALHNLLRVLGGEVEHIQVLESPPAARVIEDTTD